VKTILDMPIIERHKINHLAMRNVCVKYRDGILAWIDAKGNTLIEAVDSRRHAFKLWKTGTYDCLTVDNDASLEEATLHWIMNGGTLT
jgi:hypothetical protein